MLFQCYKKYSFLILVLMSFVTPVQADFRAFACEPEWAALVKSLGGNHASVYTATTNQQDPHHIQARPSLISKARRADILICTGAELEIGWLPLLQRKSANPKIQSGRPGNFMATNYVTLLEKPTLLDRSQGDIHSKGNPHIQLDPVRMLKVAEYLNKTLIKIDPGNQSDYQKNFLQFKNDWQAAMSRWKNITKNLQGKSIVVQHASWVYLEKWLGLNQLATLEPKPGIPPSSSHLSKLVASMKKAPADFILYASYQDGKAANWLSDKTSIPVIAVDFSPNNDESLIEWFDRLINDLSGVK